MARILLVDDDAVQRVIARAVLTQAGHEVLEAKDGQDGLQIARAQLPDLVVCDVLMPIMNGLQFVTALRQEQAIAGIPVMFLTLMSERSQVRLGMNSGADDYLPKPFTSEELTEAVDALLAKRRVAERKMAAAMNDSLAAALAEQREELASQYELHLAEVLSARWDEQGRADADLRYLHAVVLKVRFADAFQGHASQAGDLNALMRRAYAAIGDALHLFSATHLLPAGNDIVAIYSDAESSVGLRAAVRAMRSSLAIHSALESLLASVARPASAPATAPRAAVALHSSPVTLLRVGDPLHGGPVSSLMAGPGFREVDAICDAACNAYWRIAASAAYVAEFAGQLQTARSMTVRVAGGEVLACVEAVAIREAAE